MNLLLDTHIFLWYLTADKRLSKRFKTEVENPINRIFISVITNWESSLKYALGKLPLPQAPAIYLPVARVKHGFESLPIDELVFPTLASLPLLHRDPFDRMLVAQAIHHNLLLVTEDPQIQAYPVARL